MIKFFKKSNKPYLGAILGPFFPNLGKNEFSWKKGLCQFLDIPIIYHFNNNQKKLLSRLWEKTPNWRMDRWIFGQKERQKRLF